MIGNGDKVRSINPPVSSFGEKRKFNWLELFINRRRLKAAERVLRQLSLSNEAPRVLELGCGFYGVNISYLKRRFPKASFVGVDLRVEKSFAINGIELVEGNLNTWEPDASYDCVLSLAVAEHLVDLPRHFRLISQSLVAGGTAIITTPKPQAHFILWLGLILGIFDRESIEDHKLYLTRSGIEVLANQSSLRMMEHHSILILNQSFTLIRKQDN
ncbi:class I SAM-dependent methyltransferase [Chloroflexota bacterium]